MEFRIQIYPNRGKVDVGGCICMDTRELKPTDLTPSEAVELIKQLCDLNKAVRGYWAEWAKAKAQHQQYFGEYLEDRLFTDYLKEEMK
jgi:hypothetical protein